MSVDPNTLEEFSEQAVLLHRILEDGSVEELEGRVEAASAAGLAFKEKGKRDVILILPQEIEEIEAAPETPKKLAQKTLKAVTRTNVRQHLLDRHGLTRPEANAMTDEAAWDMHEEADHSELGHKHEEDDEEADLEIDEEAVA